MCYPFISFHHIMIPNSPLKITPKFLWWLTSVLDHWLIQHPKHLANSAFSKKLKVKVTQSCPTLCNSMEFSRPECWSGQPFPSPGNLPNPGIKPRSPTLQTDSRPAEPQRKPKSTGVGSLSLLQQIFPIQELKRGLLRCRQILYQLSYQRASWLLKVMETACLEDAKWPTSGTLAALSGSSWVQLWSQESKHLVSSFNFSHSSSQPILLCTLSYFRFESVI